MDGPTLRVTRPASARRQISWLPAERAVGGQPDTAHHLFIPVGWCHRKGRERHVSSFLHRVQESLSDDLQHFLHRDPNHSRHCTGADGPMDDAGGCSTVWGRQPSALSSPRRDVALVFHQSSVGRRRKKLYRARADVGATSLQQSRLALQQVSRVRGAGARAAFRDQLGP